MYLVLCHDLSCFSLMSSNYPSSGIPVSPLIRRSVSCNHSKIVFGCLLFGNTIMIIFIVTAPLPMLINAKVLTHQLIRCCLSYWL